MQRRELMALLLGGAAAATARPLTARAQQPSAMRRIAVLASGNADSQAIKTALAAFERGLQQLGWTDGRNMRIDGQGAWSRIASDAARPRR